MICGSTASASSSRMTERFRSATSDERVSDGVVTAMIVSRAGVTHAPLPARPDSAEPQLAGASDHGYDMQTDSLQNSGGGRSVTRRRGALPMPLGTFWAVDAPVFSLDGEYVYFSATGPGPYLSRRPPKHEGFSWLERLTGGPGRVRQRRALGLVASAGRGRRPDSADGHIGLAVCRGRFPRTGRSSPSFRIPAWGSCGPTGKT